MLREHNWIFQEALESLKVFMEDQDGKGGFILAHFHSLHITSLRNAYFFFINADKLHLSSQLHVLYSL